MSGHRRGVSAAMMRGVLRAAEVPYTIAVAVRNRRFDRGHAPTQCAGVPVISVGNLTLGGTGKTPLVEWLARWIRAQGVRVALVSRGYGAEQGSRNDEALELEQKLPDVPHLQNPDRLAACLVAVEELEMQLIVLDDGFQHRRLARDLDIVLIDALEPFGFGHVFPRGTLREPVASLRRADIVVLSRADMVDDSRRHALREPMAQYAPQALWCEAVHAPRSLINCWGNFQSHESLQGQSVAAFCGIGNPAGFRLTLESCGYDVAKFREFPDHHTFSRADIDSLGEWADQIGAAAVVCTQKDLVKIGVPRLGAIPLWAIGVELQFRVGQNELERRLQKLLADHQLADLP